MKTALWIIGEPATGKTTLARGLLGVTESNYVLCEKPKWTFGCNPYTIAAGHYKGNKFDGADTVPYNGVVAALDYWRDLPNRPDLTIFDGDRFSHAAAVNIVKPYVGRIACVYLFGNSDMIAKRREARSQQDPTWAKGRLTKAKNFSLTFPDRVEIDATLYDEKRVLELTRGFLAGETKNEPVTAKQEGMFA